MLETSERRHSSDLLCGRRVWEHPWDARQSISQLRGSCCSGATKPALPVEGVTLGFTSGRYGRSDTQACGSGFPECEVIAIVGKIILLIPACGALKDPSTFEGSLNLHSLVHVKSICGA